MIHNHGLIGCGRVAKNHIDGFLRAGVKVSWLCDLVEQKAITLTNLVQTAEVTIDYRQVLDDARVDSVSIAVDHAHHYQLAKEALLRDKHVFLEKPIALTMRDATELIALAEARSRILAVASQHRYDPLVSAVRSLVESGCLGELTSLAFTLISERDADYYRDSYWRGTLGGEGGSALINQGYHLVDLMVWLGGTVGAVSGTSATRKLSGVIETEETFCGLLAFENGALGTINCTLTGSQKWNTYLSIAGTGGDIQFDINMPNEFLSSGLNSDAKELLSAAAKEGQINQSTHLPGPFYYGTSHRRQIAEFVKAVQDGTTVSVDGSEARKTLGTILALYSSAVQQRLTDARVNLTH